MKIFSPTHQPIQAMLVGGTFATPGKGGADRSIWAPCTGGRAGNFAAGSAFLASFFASTLSPSSHPVGLVSCCWLPW